MNTFKQNCKICLFDFVSFQFVYIHRWDEEKLPANHKEKTRRDGTDVVSVKNYFLSNNEKQSLISICTSSLFSAFAINGLEATVVQVV